MRLPDRHLPSADDLQEQLRAMGVERLARAGLRRDPGSYNLLVHIVPPEVARDHAATEAVVRRLAQPPGPVCLYLHIAPCTGRCTFCHYAVEVNPAAGQLDRYVQALLQQITLRWAGLDARSPVRSVMIGGGTPTYLSAAQLDRLLGHLHRTVTLPSGIEFSVECSPETVTPEKLAVLRRHGVNRLSVGIQAFDDGLLRLLGRRHDKKGALLAFEQARAAGFEHLNLDLIYALPGQTLQGWLQDVSLAADLEVDSLTTYHLRKRPDTVISRHPSPAEDLNLQMHLGAMRVLQARGYRHSLVDYFCKAALPTAQIQARDKWRDMQPVDGIGPEACTRRPDIIAFDHADFTTWTESALRGDGPGGLPLANGRWLSVEEQMAQRAMFALKVLDPDGGLYYRKFEAQFGQSLQQAFGETPAELVALGALSDAGDRLQLTEIGSLLADEVCQRFYTEDLRRRMVARVRVRPEGAAVAVPRGADRQAAQSAEVLVVGAGVAGLAAAVALARDHGAGVVLLDAQNSAGQGATAAAIGGFRTQFADPVLAELSARALPVYERMSRAPGGEAIGLRRNGYLFLASGDADEELCARQAAHALERGEPVQRLTPAEAAELVPGMFTGDLTAAWWGPRDGQLDPHGIARALQQEFVSLGGRLLLGHAARALRVHKGSVVGVDTAQGWIAARSVVLATGGDTPTLLQTAGVQLPLQVARRRIRMARGPGLPPLGGPLVLQSTPPLYFRPESDGLLVSARELSNDPAWVHDAAAGLEQDWASVVAERAIARLPALQNAKFSAAWSGVQTHVEDGRPLVGPCPGLDGAWLVTALGGAGIMHAPALAQLLAAWLAGTADGPLADALDPRRLRLQQKP